jgi:glycosyltransferase involved in cell wall biosynthesis
VKPNVTLAHHWLVTDRGGEAVLREFSRLFPGSPICTLVYKPDAFMGWLEPGRVITSPLQHLPGSTRHWRSMLPLHPWAFRRLRVPADTRLVLTSDAAMTKGLAVPPGIPHVCYIHSPPRYLWGMEAAYLENSSRLGWLGRTVFNLTVPRARAFDRAAAQRVDHFIANSQFVRERVKQCYGRDADVIHPPVNVAAFSPSVEPGDSYLCVSQLVPYKRIDLAVRACTALKRKLVVIGEGSELAALQRIAGPTVTLLGKRPFAEVKWHFEHCRALLHPQIEDFGITVLEAQAAGRPVIAFGEGGARETIREGETGLFFAGQNPESLAECLLKFEAMTFDPARCRANAEGYEWLLARYPQLAGEPP